MKHFYLLLTLFFLASCGNKKEELKQIVTDQSTEHVKEMVLNETIPPMFKGMTEHPDNQLGGLKVGDIAPDFTAKTADGDLHLRSELKDGPIALVFYRGFWCPKCTKHLAQIEEDLHELQKKNVRIFAVTPETADRALETKERSEISFPIISDSDESIMKNYKVYYKVSDDYKQGLEINHNQSEAFLPVPATYLIGQDGKIKYMHYDHDYSDRASVADMLSVL